MYMYYTDHSGILLTDDHTTGTGIAITAVLYIEGLSEGGKHVTVMRV